LGGSSTSRRLAEPNEDNSSSEDESGEEESSTRKIRLRRRGNVNYDVLDGDAKHFARPESRSEAPHGAFIARGRPLKEKTEIDIGREYAKQQASESVFYAPG
jgi:hypothetical protein